MRRYLLLFAVVVMALSVAAPASAGNGNADENKNSPAYWEAKFPWLDCYKVEGGDSYKVKAHDDYELVIVKGGPYQRTYWNVDKYDWLYAPWNSNSGKKYDISYVIYCTCEDGERPST